MRYKKDSPKQPNRRFTPAPFRLLPSPLETRVFWALGTCTLCSYSAMKANTLLPLTVVPHDCGTTTLHRAKLIARKAEPGGSRGTVVIVRTRVGFGISLVGGAGLWSSHVCRCSNGRSAPQTATFGDPRAVSLPGPYQVPARSPYAARGRAACRAELSSARASLGKGEG